MDDELTELRDELSKLKSELDYQRHSIDQDSKNLAKPNFREEVNWFKN